MLILLTKVDGTIKTKIMINELLQPYSIELKSHKTLVGYDSINYKITTTSGQKFVLKYYKDVNELAIVEAENNILRQVKNLSIECSELLPNSSGRYITEYKDGSFSRLLTFVEGSFVAEVEHTLEMMISFGEQAAKLDQKLKTIHEPRVESRKFVWDSQYAHWNKPRAKYIKNAANRKLVDYYFDQFEQKVLPILHELPQQIIHNDLNEWNVLTKDGKISGCIDFGDLVYSQRINELSIAMAYLMFNKENPLEFGAAFVEGYQSISSLEKREIEILAILIPIRLAVSLSNSAIKQIEVLEAAKKENTPEQELKDKLHYITISERPAWKLLHQWISYNPVQVTNLFLKSAGFEIPSTDDLKNSIANKRKQYFGKSLSLSYDEPIHFEQSAFQYMYDVDGNTYLDAYNNIPLVGHSHPRISAAISQQIRNLNTNTRYHYQILSEYAEKLLAKFPQKLNKVFIVNSGSEASDLATRIAQTVTNRKDIITIAEGYHGNTSRGIAVSDYKFNGKGGSGQPAQTHTLPLPKLYNGDFETSEAYIADATQKVNALIEKGIHPAAFIAEAISGCGGQVPLADGYLKAIFPLLEKHGILKIVDEVQTGFGRVGKHFWAFELHDVVPDIVILGKPMGNGFPIAAVVTTTEIADKFANGMEFFSSFGGNPVSCHAANAVLEIIEEEQLQANALEVGNYYKAQLKALQNNYSVIGDVRGEGLFLGVEMIYAGTVKPNTALAKKIKNAMKANFILCSTDGKYDNTIKTKPPLCFTKANVDQFCTIFEKVLKKL
jgi:4-aminobutyrate aminotransferase-like enzyme/aminoglycoside phosphotransferase (APT) family kinase protein